MELIVATHQLAAPGGPQSYALTVAEHLARLGHSVTLYAREIGAMAALARERCLNVSAELDELPERAEGVIVGVDRSLAFELAGRYPDAVRVFVVHGIDDIHLPPPVDGVVAATVALNDRLAVRAAACVGAGEVVRMRQPVDMRRFSAGKQPAPRPARVLLLGNYHGAHGSRAQVIMDAWSRAGLSWDQVGHPSASLAVAERMTEADIVVGYGRSIIEAMACERPAYVFDHAGGDGWVTPDSYERIEAAGFSGLALGTPPDAARLRADLDAYRPELGKLGRDLVRTHHDARQHAAELVALLRRLSPEPLRSSARHYGRSHCSPRLSYALRSPTTTIASRPSNGSIEPWPSRSNSSSRPRRLPSASTPCGKLGATASRRCWRGRSMSCGDCAGGRGVSWPGEAGARPAKLSDCVRDALARRPRAHPAMACGDGGMRP